MITFLNRKYSKKAQFVISILLVMVVGIISFFSANFIGYRVVALLLMVTVSLLAMVFEIFPVLMAALLSAIIWNFFFIPPIFTFHINNAEDVLMFLMYFVIASVNAVFTAKIRQQEKKVKDKEQKEATIRLYNTLLNSLSHELRTPIATIIGAVDTLKENNINLSKANQTQLLSEIDIASIRLNRQVENLLNMSRLETGTLQLHFDWCDVNELVYNTIQKISENPIKQTIVFKPQENLPFFKLDGGLIEQVLYNIIHNAIHYTPEDSTICITTDLHNDHCIIAISDNGQGFLANEIPLAFDKFYRLPHSKTGGVGLGLSIAKGFILAHHGSIQLENNENGGAKFTIQIPAQTSYINHLKNE